MTAVLVVDDEPTLARSLCRELSQHGFETHTSTTAEDGATILGRTAIDVLVTDPRMPGSGDGTVLIGHALALAPDNRIISANLRRLTRLSTADDRGEDS